MRYKCMGERQHQALLLTFITVIGLGLGVLGATLHRPILLSVGVIIGISPLLGFVAYVCWSDSCGRSRSDVLP